MAFDGVFLSHIVRELEQAVGSRIDKIYLPSRDEIVLTLSKRGFAGKLLMTVSGVGPRVHFTAESFENPAVPPMFCMLMRKHFSSARLEGVRQNGLDRVLFLDFSAYSEMGDPVELTIAVEIMGRQSNIVLLCDGRVLDALRRSDPESGGRLILPGAVYEAPPMQNKLDPRCADISALAARIRESDDEDAKQIAAAVEGVSPLVAREIVFYAAQGTLEDALRRWSGYLSQGVPTLVLNADGTPADFTYLPIAQYGDRRTCRTAESFSALCDAFYRERRSEDAIRRRTHEISRLTATLIERTARKIEKQRGELARCDGKEQLRVFGELLKANLHSVERGAAFADVVNYYDPDGKTVRIPLKPNLSPSQNAQRYFTEYRKANTAQEMLTQRIGESAEELSYLESVADELTRASSERELAEIRAELAEAGYLRVPRTGKKKTARSLPPLHFVSDDGFDIYVGRNNKQNDELTLHTAAKSDLWLHVKGVHGTHTVVSAMGREIPPTTLMQAAMLAAYHSRARQSGGVAVDYCPIRHVRKPAGARPGMVIYDQYETVYVTPDAALAERLRADDR